MDITDIPTDEGLLHHGDRGSQHTGDDHMHLLQKHGMEMSINGLGQCWDDAVKESLWATLKTELVNHERYATRERAGVNI